MRVILHLIMIHCLKRNFIKWLNSFKWPLAKPVAKYYNYSFTASPTLCDLSTNKMKTTKKSIRLFHITFTATRTQLTNRCLSVKRFQCTSKGVL